MQEISSTKKGKAFRVGIYLSVKKLGILKKAYMGLVTHRCDKWFVFCLYANCFR